MQQELFPFRDWLKANRLSPATGYRLAGEGALRIVKVRSRTYIKKTDADAWLASLSGIQRQQSAA